MATTTPNYGWDVPTSTDYVKDGATAIETLGDDIDATLYTALGGAYPGLRLIKKQTIGSAVASVNVTSAFSATYQNYKIIVTGGTKSDSSPIRLKLGSSTTGYNYVLLYATFSAGSPLGVGSSGDSSFLFAGGGDGNGAYCNIDLLRPFDAAYTQFSNTTYGLVTTAGWVSGIHKVGTSYTDFTVLPDTGTLTGGTVYVYGYGAS
jgi:hypothetical protein